MSLFKSRRPTGEMPGPLGLTTGSHRSPGLAALCQELDKHRPAAILDLGPSSTENLRFFSRFTENVTIQDVVRSSGVDLGRNRTTALVLAAAEVPLPEDGGRYDVILLWDLIHYVDRSQLPAFFDRIRGLSRPGTLVLLLAASNAPIPPLPVHFKIEGRDRLFYASPSERGVPIGGFTPRGIEILLRGYTPLRLFQLRNGVQEFLFRCDAAPSPAEERSEQPAPQAPGPSPPPARPPGGPAPDKAAPHDSRRGKHHRGPRRYGWRG